MNLSDKARIYRELSKLLGSGFHIDRTVELLLGQNPGSARRDFLLAIGKGLAQRLSFADALRANHQGQASEMELSLLSAGERSGRLAESCAHLSHYFTVWEKGVSEARSAMIYPLILLHLGVVLPQFSRSTLLGAMGKEVHLASAIGWRLFFFWAGLAILWMLWRTLSAAATHSRTVDEALGLIPLIGGVRRHWALARFCQVFHSGLLAAIRMSDCLTMAGEASQSGSLRSGAVAAAKLVATGAEIAPSLQSTRAFDKSFVDSVATAEIAGGLDNEMARWAEAETEMASAAQHRAAEWYPKALYFAVLAYVGYSIVSFVTDYFGQMNSILQN